MRVMYNVKHCHAIRLKFGNKLLTFLSKLVLEAKAKIYSTIKENLLLYCRKSSAFVVLHNLTYFYNKAYTTKKHRL